MKPAPAPLRWALRLGLLGLCAVLLLESLARLTAPQIEAARQQLRREALALALPASHFDNAIEQDWVAVRAPRWLGSAEALKVYRGRRGDRAAGWVVEAVAPDGYGGAIKMLLGVDASGRVQGVRLTEHRETPGLGDYVDALRDDWAETLRGRALGDPDLPGWRVAKEGGRFRYVAGATLSPRAVVAAVRRALQFIERHGTDLRQAPTASRLEFNDGP